MKTTYDYVLVKVPTIVKDKVDKIHLSRKSKGDDKCRKADVWIEMANKVKK